MVEPVLPNGGFMAFFFSEPDCWGSWDKSPLITPPYMIPPPRPTRGVICDVPNNIKANFSPLAFGAEGSYTGLGASYIPP